jgi:anti-anti-sigma factor
MVPSSVRAPAATPVAKTALVSTSPIAEETEVSHTQPASSSGSIRPPVLAPVAGGAVTVALTGEIDIDLVEPLRTCMIAGIARGRDVIVDLSATTLIDCAALAVLVEAARQAEAGGHRICLSAPPELVRRTLAAVDLEAVLPTAT